MQSQAPQVFVFGSLNMDLVVRVPRVPDDGETLQAHGFVTNPGGKGANQAVACARQGAHVSMVGCVGDDAFGRTLRAALEADAIDVSHVRTAGATSGIAVIMVDDHAHNRIAIVPGANALLRAEDAQCLAGELGSAASLLLLQFEVPMDTVVRAASFAHSSGRTVMLNPAPVHDLPEGLWPLVDILVVNETEAGCLLGASVTDVASAAAAARALRRRATGTVIVTLGSAGVVVADGNGCRHFEALRVDAVDTTAAGDTFIGALAAALVAGETLDAAVARGIRAAALCVTRLGAQVSIPYRGELDVLPEVRPATSLS